MTVGSRGPILLQDHVLVDELAHFDRERIPERVVHAKGAGKVFLLFHLDLHCIQRYTLGAFGYFEVTNDISKFCKAAIFSDVGKQTPIAVRFSTV